MTLASCKEKPKINPNYRAELAKPEYFHQSLEALTDVIVHDIFSPPVASRIYVYPCVAAYETIIQDKPAYKSLGNQLSGLKATPQAKEMENISLDLAALEAFLVVGKALIFSEEKIETYQKELYVKLDSIGVPKNVWDNSMSYGQEVATHILAWADKDKYKETRSFPKFTITEKEEEWKPTPPAYMEGIEPHWREIRTLIIQSADQFKPNSPAKFNLKKDSDFYKKTMEVYDAVANATEEQKLIASFWDCNPYVMNQTGHMMFATKKITPGGHWMGITNIAAKKANLNMAASMECSTLTAISLFDAFISCWDEKYRSNLIRPETVINQYLNLEWQPLLQTPPFPEHTSGHSVISTSAALTLTKLLGDGFAFTDDVEVKYGLPQRSFDSFIAASQEAAISRLYGGIHYMPAITEGVEQGQKVATFISENLQTRN